MKKSNKLPHLMAITLVLSGCATTDTFHFDSLFGDDSCEKITIIAFLPTVVSDLDYKSIQGAKDQVIIPSEFQHALTVSGHKKSISAPVTPAFESYPFNALSENYIPKTETVLFEFDQSSISDGESKKLDDLIHKIESSNLMHVSIEGHTDSKGSAKYNKILSVKRAIAVKDYLVQHGISESKISTKGFGETSPEFQNDTEIHRAQNRRANLIPMTGN